MSDDSVNAIINKFIAYGYTPPNYLSPPQLLAWAFDTLLGLIPTAGGISDIVGAGPPTNGAMGTGAGVAGPGSRYTDTTGADLYINTNTKASPTWNALRVEG